MQAAYLTLVYLAVLTLGAAAPFAFGLGYVWVDVFSPQLIASAFLNVLPVSLIMAAAALGAYLLADRKAPPQVSAITVITVLLAVWVTLTTTWAVAPPDLAWSKWDWAFKSLLASAFLPFIFRSRIQIEAFLLVFTLSVAGHFLPFGIKNLISGGGYGRSFGLIAGNSGIAEGSTLAALGTAVIPLMLYFKDHGVVLPRTRPMTLMWWGLIVAAVSAVIATYERTGLVALAVLAAHLWLTSKRKILIGALLVGVAVIGASVVATSYADRLSTIGDYNSESSAFGRILVWRWTLGFVADHPFGGGFNAYVVDQFSSPLADGTILTIHGKAFHSVYFEVLGEHGYVGLAMFVALLALSFGCFWRAFQRTRPLPEFAWCSNLSKQLIGSLAILCASGLFISIAMQPEFPYLFASAACLRAHLQRALPQSGAARAAGRSWSRRIPHGEASSSIG